MFITSLKTVPNLPEPPLGLLPAVHDATITEIAGPWIAPAPGAVAGEVFMNGTGSPLVLPEHEGWPSVKLRSGGYFACDGRCFYEVNRHLATNSFYPAHFERTLFTVSMTPRILPLGGTIRLERGFGFRLFNNVSNAVWHVIWEIGVRTSLTMAGVGPNLEGFNWLAPIVDQEVVLTDIETWHGLGVVIQNSNSGYIGTQLAYERTIGASEGSMPPTDQNDFVLRCRLSLFDTEDSVTDPRGYVAYTASDIKAINEDKE